MRGACARAAPRLGSRVLYSAQPDAAPGWVQAAVAHPGFAHPMVTGPNVVVPTGGNRGTTLANYCNVLQYLAGHGVWEQTAHGSGGETMAYEPLGEQRRAAITDVRPGPAACGLVTLGAGCASDGDCVGAREVLVESALGCFHDCAEMASICLLQMNDFRVCSNRDSLCKGKLSLVGASGSQKLQCVS